MWVDIFGFLGNLTKDFALTPSRTPCSRKPCSSGNRRWWCERPRASFAWIGRLFARKGDDRIRYKIFIIKFQEMRQHPGVREERPHPLHWPLQGDDDVRRGPGARRPLGCKYPYLGSPWTQVKSSSRQIPFKIQAQLSLERLITKKRPWVK